MLLIKRLLYPHISHDGKRIVWAELIDQTIWPSGKWVIKLADIAISKNEAELENVITITPGSLQFYETHGFSPDDSALLFSASHDGNFQNPDIYAYNLETETLTRLTGQDSKWDAQYAPDGTKIIWMSSKGIPQAIKQYELKSDCWMMDSDGGNKERIPFLTTHKANTICKAA